MTRVKLTDTGDGEGAISDQPDGAVPDQGEIVHDGDGNTYVATGETTRYAGDGRETVVQAELEKV